MENDNTNKAYKKFIGNDSKKKLIESLVENDNTRKAYKKLSGKQQH